MNINEELKELNNMAIKLQQDIEALNKERSGLANELAEARKNYKKELDTEYAGMKAALQARYDQLLAEEKDKIEQAKEKLAEASVIHARNKEVLELSNQNAKELEARSQALDEKYAVADKEIAGVRAQLEEKMKVYEHAIEENAELKTFLLAKKTELDNREFQIGEEMQKVEKVKQETSALLIQDNDVLNKFGEQQAALKKEGEEVLAIYAQVKAEKEELQKLQSLKDDIVKLEALKKEVEDKQLKLDASTMALAKRGEVLHEKELTLSERDKLQNVREKEITGKIETLNKLREAMGKNA
jgi:hypothetical protein